LGDAKGKARFPVRQSEEEKDAKKKRALGNICTAVAAGSNSIHKVEFD
jgi:hypothetical protein